MFASNGHHVSVKWGMADRPDDSARRPQTGATGLLPTALVAAVREACEPRAMSVSTAARRAGVGDLLARIEAGEAAEDELLFSHVAALSDVLDVRMSELVARAEELAREGGER